MFNFVQLKCACDAFDDFVGNTTSPATLQAGVVLDTDSCQSCDLFTPETGDPASTTVVLESSCLG